MRLSLRFSSSLRADGLMSMAYLATQAPARDHIGFDSFEGNAFLLAPPFRNKTVVEIFPKRPVLAQVNLDGHLAAFLVCQKFNSGHDGPLLGGPPLRFFVDDHSELNDTTPARQRWVPDPSRFSKGRSPDFAPIPLPGANIWQFGQTSQNK